MNDNLEDLKVRPGEDVFVAFARLRQWARRGDLYKGDPRIRFNQVAGRGTFVTADIVEESWTPKFLVELSGLKASIGLGTVNGLDVHINKVSLDGEGEGGMLMPVPTVTVSPPGNQLLKSWVCVRVEVGPLHGTIDPESRDAITVVHVDNLETGNDLIGLQALALLKWNSNAPTVKSIHQIVMHDLKHEFIQGDPKLGRATRHIFSAV